MELSRGLVELDELYLALEVGILPEDSAQLPRITFPSSIQWSI